MKNNFLKSSTLLLSLLLSANLFAWGDKGHSLVAEIAFKQLDRKTKKIVLNYLNGMSIEEAANWMDAVKKDRTYDYLKPLHYVNFEKEAIVKDSCCDNIISTLNTTIKELQNYKSLKDEDIKTKLCYLFHLMGDLHQPLHIGYGGDKGGNSFQVSYNGKGTNLHALYDFKIIEKEGLTLKDCLKEHKYSKTEIDSIEKGSIVDWATQSRSFLDQIYATDGHKISDEYVTTNYPMIKSQIHLAGIRLAGILEEIFKEK